MTSGQNDTLHRGFSRGVGIGLVVALSGLLLVGFSFAPRPGIGMMGQSPRSWSTNGVCTPPSNSVKQSLDVTVSDMGMMMNRARRMVLSASPSTLVSGKVNILVTNFGMRTHEVVILPLANGQSAGQRIVGTDGKVDETGSVGEVSNNCNAGVGEGILPGSRGWATVDLAPGRYELICNLPGHYAAGMYYELQVNSL